MTETASPCAAASPADPRRRLTIFDSTSIIVGIIIGVGIYESSPLIARNVAGPGWLIAAWALGGALSLVGALCYAELATAYPKEGGDYVYLTHGFGRPLGFLFAWSQAWVVRPGSIGAYAYVFARYANRLIPLGEGPYAVMLYAAAPIVVLTVINVLGVRPGKTTQNVLTVVKVAGLAAVVVVGIVFGGTVGEAAPAEAGQPDFGLAMIFILYTYGGWHEMAYVAAEVRNPRKNILRALVIGTVAVTAIYVLANLAFLYALGFAGTRASEAVAADTLELALAEWGAKGICLLVCVSALGGLNGMIFTGARIYYAMGTEHRLYAWLGRWSDRLGTPAWSLVFQGVVTLALVVGFGLTASGFESMVKFTAPVFWGFFLLVGVSVFVLRWREPSVPRPYRVPAYPVLPILFCGSSLFMLYASLDYAIAMRSYEALWSIALMVVGLALCFWDRRPAAPSAA